MFVAVGEGRYVYSTDGKTFNEVSISGIWSSICYGNNMFVVVDQDKCAYSTDGKTFTNGTISSGTWYSVCYGKVQSTQGEAHDMFVTVSYSDGKYAWSTDGKTFTEGNLIGDWRLVCYGNNMFVAVGVNKCAYSTDGKTFTEGSISSGTWDSVCYGNDMFVAVSNNKSTYCASLYTGSDFVLKSNLNDYVLKTELQQSMTITHLAPIDEELDINSFVIGAPVYMTGKVYVK